jgi:CBS domain-containing protein
MSVRDVTSTDVPIARLENSVRDTARLTDEAHVTVLPGCGDERLVGVIDVVPVTADTTVAEVGSLIAHRPVHHLLVCDHDHCAGVVRIDVEWSQLGGPGTPHATLSATR